MKIKTLLLTTTLLASTTAFADVSASTTKKNNFKNFYGKVEAGVTMPSEIKITNRNANESHKAKSKKGFVGGIGAGYRFNEFLRSDLMLQYRQTNIKTIEGANLDNTKPKVHSSNLMLNGYLNAHNDTMFTPYAMAGVGVSINTISAKNNDNDRVPHHPKTNFACNVGLGVQAKIYEKVSIDLGYRYTSLGKPAKIKASNHIKLGNLKTHEVLLGLIYNI